MTTTPPVTNTTDEPANASWRTSSYSNGQGNCIQTAYLTGAVAVRDSKNPARGATFTATPIAWADFLAHTKRDNFAA